MRVKTINSGLLLEPTTNFEPIPVEISGLNEQGQYFIVKISTSFGFEDIIDIFIGRTLSFLMPDGVTTEIHTPKALDTKLSGFFNEKTYKIVIYI